MFHVSDVKVLPGSIDYAIAQIEKRFASEIDQLRAQLAEANIAIGRIDSLVSPTPTREGGE